MAKRPTLAESSEKPRALVCAFAQVPGSSAVGVRAEQMLLGFSNHLDVDALTLKATNLTHIQRVGAARMLRVPVPDLVSGEASLARSPFQERLGMFRRAVSRQLSADPYSVVVCLDLFAAAAAAPFAQKTKLVIEVADVPSVSFDKRWPVEAGDDVTRSEWDLAERAALKAATLVLVPSRHAARLLSDRTDPRTLRVVPRFVDTRVFQPPTVELAMDDVKTVAFLGGREGKSRSVVVAAAIQSLLTAVPDARVLVLGTPSRADQQLTEDLTRRGVVEQVVLVDVASPQDLAQALCAAHVVVVAAGAEGDIYALPHRALEAMACGRPVVLTGSEAAYKDAIVPHTHARVCAPNDPDELAAQVGALLVDETARNTLARAGLKQARRYDLQTKLGEMGLVLTEGTGVTFTAQLPPLEEHTSPAPVARAVPATPLPAPTAPRARALSEKPEPRPRAAQPVTSPVSGKPRPPAAAAAAAQRVARVAPVAVPSSVAGAAAATFNSDEEGSTGDVWAGDTLLDPLALPPVPSEPPPERVKGAMLATQSGSADRPKAQSASTTVESSGPTPVGTARTRGQGGSGPRSLQLAMADDDNDDDWSRDTVADASPLADATRPPNSGEKPPQTHPPRSFLVEAGVGDMTAEDKPATSSSSKD
ncbi:MAG: glycosyltransferase [Deltaproteobacteria bacterium]|nr:glycosyltransferase [Deltaproteobacteria bacterium]